MTRHAGVSVLLGLLMAACGVGDEGGGPGGDDGPPIEDPNPNKITCSATFKVTTGSFQLSPTPTWEEAHPPPEGTPRSATDCWPVGTWTFSAAIDPTAPVLDINDDGKGDRCGEVTGTTAPTLAATYSFKVTRTPLIDNNGTPTEPADDTQIGWQEGYEYLGDMATFKSVHVSEGGGAQCEGTLEMRSADKTAFWTFKPDLTLPIDATTGTIEGLGEYTLYAEAQNDQ
jgi:hypothetical protein